MNRVIHHRKLKPRLSERISHFIRGPNPLHPSTWVGRLAPLTFRRFKPEDLSQCLELYAQNEAGRFPEGIRAQYERSLRDQNVYFLVAESEGRIIGAGGLGYWWREHIAVLCYGLVRPEEQGKGVGTALLLARLALLNSKRPVHQVFIFAVEKSFRFYERLGFHRCGLWEDEQGRKYPSAYLHFMDTDVAECRKLLADTGIVVPLDEDRVPFSKSGRNNPSVVVSDLESL